MSGNGEASAADSPLSPCSAADPVEAVLVDDEVSPGIRSAEDAAST